MCCCAEPGKPFAGKQSSLGYPRGFDDPGHRLGICRDPDFQEIVCRQPDGEPGFLRLLPPFLVEVSADDGGVRWPDGTVGRGGLRIFGNWLSPLDLRILGCVLRSGRSDVICGPSLLNARSRPASVAGNEQKKRDPKKSRVYVADCVLPQDPAANRCLVDQTARRDFLALSRTTWGEHRSSHRFSACWRVLGDLTGSHDGTSSRRGGSRSDLRRQLPGHSRR